VFYENLEAQPVGAIPPSNKQTEKEKDKKRSTEKYDRLSCTEKDMKTSLDTLCGKGGSR
jgi:hypothetical protein